MATGCHHSMCMAMTRDIKKQTNEPAPRVRSECFGTQALVDSDGGGVTNSPSSSWKMPEWHVISSLVSGLDFTPGRFCPGRCRTHSSSNAWQGPRVGMSCFRSWVLVQQKSDQDVSLGRFGARGFGSGTPRSQKPGRRVGEPRANRREAPAPSRRLGKRPVLARNESLDPLVEQKRPNVSRNPVEQNPTA